MQSISKLDPWTRFFGLFIGRSGHGKTSAACSFPKPVIVDSDGRIAGALAAINGWNREKDVFYESIPAGGNWNNLESKLEKILEDVAKKKSDRQTIVIDSTTTISRLLLSEGTYLSGGSRNNTYKNDKGIQVTSKLSIPSPTAYGYEGNGMSELVDIMKAIPGVNVIFTAHIVDRYGKPPGENNEFAENVIVGESLSLRDKIGANLLLHFNEVYRFEAKQSEGRMKHFVNFRSDLARTTFTRLPFKPVEITGIDFYQKWLELSGAPSLDQATSIASK
jgi:hypothetical protein